MMDDDGDGDALVLRPGAHEFVCTRREQVTETEKSTHGLTW